MNLSGSSPPTNADWPAGIEGCTPTARTTSRNVVRAVASLPLSWRFCSVRGPWGAGAASPGVRVDGWHGPKRRRVGGTAVH
jgi:hypothetical protein